MITTKTKLPRAPRFHKSITPERLLAAIAMSEAALEDPGFCTACGHEQDGCEPDARKLVCEACGRPAVYGVEELVIMGA